RERWARAPRSIASPAAASEPDRAHRRGCALSPLAAIANAEPSTRNATLFREAVALAELVAARALGEGLAPEELQAAAGSAGLRHREIRLTLASAFRRRNARPRWAK